MERLVTWLWQGTVLAIGVWGLLRVWRPNAATRFAIWWATLAAVALLLIAPPLLARLPIIDAGAALFVRAGEAGAAAAAAHATAADADPRAFGALAGGNAADGASALLPFTLPEVPSPFIALGIGAWLGFSLLGFVHLAMSVVHLRKIKRACRPFPHARERRLTRWLLVRGEGRRVRLCVSDDVRSASALGVGLGPAIIAINSSLINDVDDEELDHIVLHEYAHIRRRDDWLHVLQLSVQALLVLHPAVSWIGRALRLEREAACDEWVVERTHMPTAYAQCLTKVAAFELSGPNELVAAMGILGRRGELTRRIERLLAPRRARHTHLAAFPVATVALLLMAATVGLRQLPPLVAIERAAEAVAEAASATATASESGSAAIASSAAASASEASAADLLTLPSAITILREQSQSPSRGEMPRAAVALRMPTLQLAAFEQPRAVPTAAAPRESRDAETTIPAHRVHTATPLVAMMPASGAFEMPASAARASASTSTSGSEMEAEAAAADLGDIADAGRSVWRVIADAGTSVGQRTADVSQSTAKNLAAKPSVRGTMTAGAAVGQAGASVGQNVGKGAKRAGTATGSFFTRVGTSIYKALP